MSSEPYLSEMDIFSFAFAPKNWALCNGQLLTISQNQALYSLLGTTFGGNGSTTFGLPNLQGRAPVGMGTGTGLSAYSWGQAGGSEAIPLTTQQMPVHTHSLMADASTAASSNLIAPANNLVIGQSVGNSTQVGAFPVSIYSTDTANLTPAAPAAISSVGAGQGHENRQPFMPLNFCIALAGYYPTRN